MREVTVVDGPVDEVVNVYDGGVAPNATPRASEMLKPPPDQALGSTRAYSGRLVLEGIGILGGKLPECGLEHCVVVY